MHKLCQKKFICEPDETPEFSENGAPKHVKEVQHGGCGNVQPKVTLKGLKFIATTKGEKGDEETGPTAAEEKLITPTAVLNILQRITDGDLAKMGLSSEYARPEWMVLTVLPVPPPPVRPSISVDGTGQGMRGEDDLTYKLGDIIRANSNVHKAEIEGSPQHVTTQFHDLLQYHVATYMDNDIAGQPQALQKSGRPVKSIRARLKGKEGRLRGNLMGKRVDFSARTVITGDPNLGLDQVGVPKSIARTLTYPETVTPYNIHKLHELVKNGPNEHPGARYVIRDSGERIDLRHTKQSGALQLQYGWKVERHIVDDDFVIFNRQPSLHKESMMGHRVKVMPYSTFRMNLSATGPYNADFDGDEMNLHVPQSEETRAEISQICMVPKQILTPQKNQPIMGIVQDTLCGIYKMSRRDTFLTLDQVNNILLWIDDWDGVVPPPAILKPVPRWSGKQLISMAIDSRLDLTVIVHPEQGVASYCPLDEAASDQKDDAVIIGGELLVGLMDKGMVGAKENGVIHLTYNDMGPEACLRFFNMTQRIVAYWLLHNGFSIGIGDTIPDLETISQIESAINKQKAKFERLYKKATAGTLQTMPGQSLRATFEGKAQHILGNARSDAGKAAQNSLKDLNNAVQMARSGSKGSSINISQMSALVGQQAVEGARVPFGFKYRSLPHFTKDDYSPEARGFVENSYLRGLTPTEFYFHAMAGREGLIDTAVKTAETGYIQRRLVKAMEDVQARYDGTVRNSLGDIIQFTYGEDGLDAQCIEEQPLHMLTSSNPDYVKAHYVDVMSDTSDAFLSNLETQVKGNAQCQALFEDEFAALLEARSLVRDGFCTAKKTLMLPLNIDRILDRTAVIYKLDSNTMSDLNPMEVIPLVRDFMDRLIAVRGDDPISVEAQFNATLFFKSLLKERFSFKQLVSRYMMSKLALRHALGEIENKFSRSTIAPGDMVGVVAAQSIGEPATQMTLNTFHFTGIAAKNVTLGVPRLKEILNLATNIKTPALRVYQKADKRMSNQHAQALRAKIEHTSLKTLTSSTEIYYDPDVEGTVVEADRDMVEAFWIIPDDSVPSPEVQSRWVLRIVLDKKKLLDRNLTVPEVAAVIRNFFGEQLAVIFSDDNAPQPVIRIRLVKDQKMLEEPEVPENELLKTLEPAILNKLTIKGVPGIEKAFLAKYEFPEEQPDGAVKLIKQKDADPDSKPGWILDTTGSAFRNVLAVEDVDTVNTYTNCFQEVLELMGIEAARACIYNELHMVLSFDGSYVNARHMSLLVEIMTVRGWIVPITRHGINKAETGALMRCSFEETVEILLEAAASGELDDCRGVSENVMLGQQAPLGTGEMDVLLDAKMLSTVISDNQHLGIVPGMALKGVDAEGAATPYGSSPVGDVGYAGTPDYGAAFSPINTGSESPDGQTLSAASPFSSNSGAYSPADQWGLGARSPASYMASPSSPMYSPTSPAAGGFAGTPGFSPSSPAFTPASPHYSPTSPAQHLSPTSPSYSPASPNFSPTSPSYSPTSPGVQYSPSSPKYSPTSPTFSPTSPAQQRFSPTSPGPNYSPTSPTYSPTSPAGNYSPTSPAAGSPSSPKQGNVYSPTSPNN